MEDAAQRRLSGVVAKYAGTSLCVTGCDTIITGSVSHITRGVMRFAANCPRKGKQRVMRTDCIRVRPRPPDTRTWDQRQGWENVASHARC